MERFDRLEAQIKHLPISQPAEPTNRLRLVNARALRVRQEGSANARVMTTLGMNSLVRVKDEHSRQALVEYFDFNTGKTAEGWVWKQYLQTFPGEFTK